MKTNKARLDVNFDQLNVEEIEGVLQEGSRGIPAYSASCGTFVDAKEATTTIINNSCGSREGGGVTPRGAMDDVLVDF